MLSRTVISLLAMLTLVFGLGVATTQTADAAVGNVYVRNGSTSNIQIACNYGGALKILTPNQNSRMSGKCTAENGDVDQILVATAKCMKYTGPRVTDGWYKIQSGVRLKIHDFGTANIFNFSRAECNGRPYYTTR